MLTAGLAIASGGAYADSLYNNYNEVVPIASGPAIDGVQTKFVTGASGDIRVDYVGSTYTIRANVQTLTGGGWTTWTSPLTDGSTASLPNTIASGADSYLAIRVATFSPVSVQSTGIWRSY